MENLTNSEDTAKIKADAGEAPLQELSHTDKAAGIFTEPEKTFRTISMFPLKTIDWFLPVLILLLVLSITRILVMSDEEVYFHFKQKQIQQTEKMFDEMVAKGQISREQANEQLENVKGRIDMGRGALGMIMQTVSIFIIGFIFYFIVVLVYFVFVKLILKGEGTYISALIADGLPSYILMLQVMIASILSIVFGRLIIDTSAASFLDLDKSEILGFLLGKIDPFSIWVYSVVSIGMAKMFKSSTMGKYFVLVFGVWLIGSLIIWLLGRVLPFLRFFSEM